MELARVCAGFSPGQSDRLRQAMTHKRSDEAMQKLIQSIDETLEQFQLLAEDFSEGSQMHEDMQRAIRSLEQTLFELEPALRNLRQRPNSLIFGGPSDEDPEPQGARQ